MDLFSVPLIFFFLKYYKSECVSTDIIYELVVYFLKWDSIVTSSFFLIHSRAMWLSKCKHIISFLTETHFIKFLNQILIYFNG